jgi:hypothetical protein
MGTGDVLGAAFCRSRPNSPVDCQVMRGLRKLCMHTSKPVACGHLCIRKVYRPSNPFPLAEVTNYYLGHHICQGCVKK